MPIEVSFAPIRLDGGRGVIAFLRDVTARHEAEAALQRSERRFRKLIECAPDGVWINDGQRLRYANPGAARMLGYDSVEELLAVDPRNIIAPEHHSAMRERTQEMFRTGEPLPPRDYRSRRKDGGWMVAEVQSMPIEWEGDPAILGFARDVTSRKQIEEQLAQSERLAALGTLLAGIAHEVNNPLSYALLGIEGALEALSRPQESTAALREMLERAHDGATRVSAIVSQIRTSARPDAAPRGLVDVRRALEAALRMTRNEIAHRTRLVADLVDSPPVIGSEHRLEQVFLNLVVNALHALPDGRAENELRVSLRTSLEREVVVEVTDNGEGIPDEVRARIFDPFFTTKPVGLGLGLGLSICHGIVTAHGGTIAIDSAVGRGSTFRVTLPPAKYGVGDVPSPAGPQPVDGTAARAHARVLVVDDEPLLAGMIVRVLAPDHQVDFALSARDAVERLAGATAPYDVILCDLMMPEMTGMDLFAEVARLYPGLEERFVFMTGGAFTQRAIEFLARVKNPRIEKPFDAGALREAVRRPA